MPTGQGLVRDRIGDLAETGHKVPRTGQLPVKLIGEGRGDEDERRRQSHGVALAQHEPDENRHQDEPQHGQSIGDVEQGA